MYDSLHRADKNGKFCNYGRLLDRYFTRDINNHLYIFVMGRIISNIIIVCEINKEFNNIPN